MAGSSRRRDSDLYRRYAVGLYRQALLTLGAPASAEPVVCDVIVNERALARIPERAADGARYRVSPRLVLSGGLGYVRARRSGGYPRS